MRRSSVIVLLAVAGVGMTAWTVANRPQPIPDWSGVIAGVSFNPFRHGQGPGEGAFPTAREIADDLALLGNRVAAVRTYSVLKGLDRVPALAADLGLRVMLGAWIGEDRARNREEVARLIHLARHSRNVDRVLVGNEVLLYGRIAFDDLVAQIRQVRNAVAVPVGTAEPWQIWLKHPNLADEVDFIGVHILPYWEGVPVGEALSYLRTRLDLLRTRFPDKPLVLTEVGWPSKGHRIGAAEASRVNQARFLRGFLNLAPTLDLDYFVIEAFDQPWKIAEEGRVGGHWGLFDVHREAKFPWTGAVLERPLWLFWAVLATGLGLLPAIWYLGERPGLRWPGRITFAGLFQFVGAAFVWALILRAEHYLGGGEAVTWWVLLISEALLFIALAVDAVELTDVVWNGPERRRFVPLARATDESLPKVSIHVPCCNEPPGMVRQTLDALARLDYPDFEVLVVDNNTRDTHGWRPIAAACAALGPRFRFFHLATCTGFKAGALNFALQKTAPEAEIVALIDSDYWVEPDWLRALVPHFERPEIGFVQAPQDYRDAGGNAFKAMCFWEYAAFFHIGMVQRNEADAIIQHGTMALVRKAAMVRLGGWAEWCITEDAEFGLRLLSDGWRSAYVHRSFGRGLTPDSLSAYKNQRFRWAYGAIQILKRHGRRLLLPSASRLTGGQRYHYLTGWLPWCADALGLVFTLGAIGWSFALALWPRAVGFPMAAFVVPMLGVFAFKQIRWFWLYARRVPCSARERLGAALAGLALGHTVAKAVLLGLFTCNRAFLRTPKCEHRPAFTRSLCMALEETAILALVFAAMLAIALNHDLAQAETVLWLAVLAMQALPYGAALAVSVVSARPAPRRAADFGSRKRNRVHAAVRGKVLAHRIGIEARLGADSDQGFPVAHIDAVEEVAAEQQLGDLF